MLGWESKPELPTHVGLLKSSLWFGGRYLPLYHGLGKEESRPAVLMGTVLRLQTETERKPTHEVDPYRLASQMTAFWNKEAQKK